jgi:hypothetical protein
LLDYIYETKTKKKLKRILKSNISEPTDYLLRSNYASTSTDGKIIIHGGISLTENKVLDDLLIIDTKKQEIKQLIGYGDLMLSVSGFTGNIYYYIIDLYRFYSTNKKTDEFEIPALSGHQICLLSNDLLIFGGGYTKHDFKFEWYFESDKNLHQTIVKGDEMSIFYFTNSKYKKLKI